MSETIHHFKAARNAALSRRLATALPGLLLLAACATVPQPPTQALQAAEMAIATAEKARVADYASPELSEARVKLTEARTAVQQQHMVLALRLAEQSRVDAELASAKSEEVKSRLVNDEMKKSTDTLKQEMNRNTGAK